MSRAPVFYPTLEDMRRPFEEFIERIEDKIADIGICKIVPPEGWTPRPDGYSGLDDIVIPKPIRQLVTGSKGIFQAVHMEKKSMVLSEFRELANSPENQPPARLEKADPESVERAFWKNVTHSPPLYGADGVGTLFDSSIEEWNVGKLDSLLSRTLEHAGLCIPGVTTAYLYFGMWRSMFAWHTEDVDLYSVNYLHFGEPKSWYTIPPEHRNRFERLIQGMAPHFHKNCPAFLRHKETLVTPQLLQWNNIPVTRVIQGPGEFIINFPGVYHAGFNHGFNCAESTNFATKRWVDVGVRANTCSCSGDSVKIDMRLFGVDVPLPKAPKSGFPTKLLIPRSSGSGTKLAKKHRVRRRRRVRHSTAQKAAQLSDAHPGELDQWGQCELCLKWRILPPEREALLLDMDAEFWCRMLPGTNCTTPEEPFDEIATVWDSLIEHQDELRRTRSTLKQHHGPMSPHSPTESNVLASPQSTEPDANRWVALVVNPPGSLKLRVVLKKVPEDESCGHEVPQEPAQEPKLKGRRSARQRRKETKAVEIDHGGGSEDTRSCCEYKCDFELPWEWEVEEADMGKESKESISAKSGDEFEHRESESQSSESEHDLMDVVLQVWDGVSEEGLVGERNCQLKRRRTFSDSWDTSEVQSTERFAERLEGTNMCDELHQTDNFSEELEWCSIPVEVEQDPESEG